MAAFSDYFKSHLPRALIIQDTTEREERDVDRELAIESQNFVLSDIATVGLLSVRTEAR